MMLALGLAAVIAGTGLVLPELTRPAPRPPAAAGNQLKLIQFNTFADNADPDRAAAWIARQDADIVVIEEAVPAVVRGVLRRSGYYVACPECSVVIFSRKRGIAWGAPMRQRGWGRAPLIWATFDAPGGPFTVVGVHYTWPTDGSQPIQAERLARLLDRFPKDRLILAGDFNSTPWSFARRREDARFGLERRTKALFTWPSSVLPFAFLPIDHVYAGRAWKTVKVERGPRLSSDHYPVIVTLARE
jgi:endonuclease/exonuclease/phosphatase (EEP) superfamily protein YafD